MDLVIATVSIFVITGTVWLAGKILVFKVCPLCGGVAGTWLWMLAALFLDYKINLVILALLMGGSVIAIYFKIEESVKVKFNLFTKTLFVVASFVAAYGAISSNSVLFFAAFLITALLCFPVIKRKDKGFASREKVNYLEEEMKNCC